MRKKRLKPYLFLLPTFAFLAVFTYYPIFRAIFISFFEWSTSYPEKVFNGINNYLYLIQNPLFWRVVKNTFLYSISTILIGMSSALFLAILINKKINLASVYKVSLFYPTMIPMAAASLIWMWIFTTQYGLLDFYLGKIGLPKTEWLNNEKLVLWCIVAVGVWKHVGYYMILFLAALQNIPPSLWDAAEVEGANSWQKFHLITFPMISSYTFYIFIINIMDSLQAIDQVYIMTQGGPANASNLLVYYIYEHAFRFWNMGLGSTLTTILIAFLFVFVLVIFATVGKKVYYEV
jgi:ABC-type sugar transport system permease subunit